MKRRRDNNDTDVLIETYTIRLQNHKAKIKELKKLAKKFQKWSDDESLTQTSIMVNDYANRITKIEEEVVSRQESIKDYRFDIRRLKKLLTAEKTPEFCFVCSKCGKSITDKSDFYFTKKGKILCGKCVIKGKEKIVMMRNIFIKKGGN